jgi:vacuolar-type H+-ATPase subunit E/Vma4
MKKKVLIYFLILLSSFVLVSCVNSKHDSQYRREGQVKIKNEYKSYENNVKNGAEVKGLDKFKEFMDDSKKGNKKSIVLIYINKDGKQIKSKLLHEKNMYKYYNSYVGYKVIEGIYKCKEVKVERQVTLEGCKGKKDSLLLFPLKQKQFKENF